MDSNNMKKLLIVPFMLFAVKSTAQTDDTTLVKLNKLELSKIYITEVQRVTKKLYALPLNDVTQTVPTTKYTQSKFKFINKKCDAFNTSLNTHFNEMLPYSDKQDLIKAIIYLKAQ